LICIFAVFRGDTHQDHIYGHNETGHNGQHWKIAIIAVTARLIMTINIVLMGVSSKYSKNADQQPKQFLKYRNGKKLWTKQNFHQNNGHFACILAFFLS
jgi:hypothetical protein